jgi:hypothetical protein
VSQHKPIIWSLAAPSGKEASYIWKIIFLQKHWVIFHKTVIFVVIAVRFWYPTTCLSRFSAFISVHLSYGFFDLCSWGKGELGDHVYVCISFRTCVRECPEISDVSYTDVEDSNCRCPIVSPAVPTERSCVGSHSGNGVHLYSRTFRWETNQGF